MMTATVIDRRIPLQTWPLILVQVGWLWAAFGFAYLGVIRGSESHFVMATLSLLLLVGIYFRWRAAFWASALAYAAAVGGTVARIIKLERLPLLLGVSLGIGVLLVVLHQVPPSFRWFAFQKPRSVRLGFWFLAAVACVAGELTYVILVNLAARS
jgi:hypothetical protein